MQHDALRNGDFVTPTVIGAEEYDFAERNLRYTRAMFDLLSMIRQFGGQNKEIMQQLAVRAWCRGRLPPLAAALVQPEAKRALEDGLDQAKALHRHSG